MFQIIAFSIIMILAIASLLSFVVEKLTTGQNNIDMLLVSLSCMSGMALIVSLI